MKTRNIIGGSLAIIGITAAICVADGSAYELAIRFGGVALFAIGAFIAKDFDFQQENK